MKKIWFFMATLIIFLGCRKERDEVVEADKYVNNNLVLSLWINGQKIDTVYKDSTFQVKLFVNLFRANFYQTSLNGQTFYDTAFTDAIKTTGRYVISALVSNGARTFRDTARLFVIDYPLSPAWLPGLWGDLDSARFRIGADTIFFNSAYCSTRVLPFIQFADSLDKIRGHIVFNDSINIRLLNYYMNPKNSSWYFYPIKKAVWTTAPDGQKFLLMRYGGDFNNAAGSFANMGGASYNDSLKCYVIQDSYLKWK